MVRFSFMIHACNLKWKKRERRVQSGEKKLDTSYFCNILVSTPAFHPIAIFWGWLSFSDKKYAWLFHWKPPPSRPSRLPNAMASGGSLARHRMMMVAPIIVMAKEYDGIGALLQVSFLSKMQVSLSTVHGSILLAKLQKSWTTQRFLFFFLNTFFSKNVV